MLEKLHLELASVLGIGGAIAFSIDCAIAQVVPDASLGTESSVVIPQAPSSNVDLIQGGATRGANLFHSFEQFSVLTGREAFFNNATDIQNIISRVTGASISNIDGLIRANGTANLFLINPNGIIFGPNATLSIGGSFLGSTASSLNFGDGSQFSTTAPQMTSLLTVSVPLGLQFGGTIGDILNQSRLSSNNQLVGLQVPSGKTLALVGGDVTLDRGVLTAPGGRIELGGLSGAGTVGMIFEGNNLRLEYPNEVARADIFLTNAARADASGQGGGAIQVQGRRVRLADGSQIRNQTLGSIPGGTLSVTATELVELIGVSGTSASGLIAEVRPEATGRGSNITIETQRLTIQDGARISTTTRGQGAGGNLEVNASESVELIETQTPSPTTVLRSALFANVSGSTGDGGNLTVETRRLNIRDGATIDASSFGTGDAGNLTVRASESVELSGTSADPRLPSNDRLGRASSLRTETRDPGDAGNLRIETGQLTIRDGAQVSVSSSTRRGGSPGNLEIAARSIRLDNQGSIQATVRAGNQGNIRLDSQDLVLRNGSFITTNAQGTATGGNITIDTDNLVALENSDIRANAVESFGGRVIINAQGIFGPQFREQETLESDITAISAAGSQFNGIVELNTPEVDPSQGLVTLPAELVDVSNQIAQGCAGGSESIAKNKFIITGRGGLPPSPNEPLNSETVLTEWATLDPSVENRSDAPYPNVTRGTAPTTIVEAQGWAIAPNGEVILTASATTIPNSSRLIPTSCNGS